VDVTVQAQGEATFVDIVQRLCDGRSLEGCAGCMYRRADGSVHVNPPRALLPIDRFRPHDYDLIDVERYYELKGKRQLDYISSQGCNFRCAFCSDPFVYGRKWVGIEPGSMVAKLRALWEKYRFDDLNFQDETFFTKRERIRSMAQQIVDSGHTLATALRVRDRNATAALIKRFRFLLAHQPNVSQAQHDAVKAYDNRLVGISKLQGTIAREHQRLQNLLS